MGFSNLWLCFDKPEVFFTAQERRNLFKQELKYIPSGNVDEQPPVLLVDLNNVAGVAEQSKTGHSLLCDVYVEKFWTAILTSGYEVRIVKDGDHSAKRGVTKLMRMYSDMDAALFESKNVKEIFADMKCDKTSGTVARSRRTQVLIDNNVTVARAREEADEDIRIMCRELVAENRRVCVLSNDASLVIGVPSAVSIFSPSRGVLVQCKDAGSWRLHGPMLTVQNMIESLERYTKRLFPTLPRSAHFDSTSLCYVAALLGGDGGRGTLDKEHDPFSLLYFTSDYLIHRRSLKSDDFLYQNKARLLVAGVAVIMSWRGSLGRQSYSLPSETPSPMSLCRNLRRLMDDITFTAREIVRPQPRSPPLFGLPRGNPDGMYKSASQALNLSATRITENIVTRLHETMDGALKGNDEVNVLYKSTWGVWTSAFEPAVEDTELILSPVISLCYQLSVLRHLSLAPDLFKEAVAQSSGAIDFTGQIMSPAMFNSWFSIFRKKDLESKLRSDNDGTKTTATLFLKSCKRMACDCPQEEKFSEKSLNDFVKNRNLLPTKGFIASSQTRECNFGWDIQLDDDFGRTNCVESFNYLHGDGNAVLNLMQRYHLFQSLMLNNGDVTEWNVDMCQSVLVGCVDTIADIKEQNVVTAIIDLCVEWWNTTFAEQNFPVPSELAVTSGEILCANIKSYACSMLTTLHSVLSCLKASGVGIKNSDVKGLIYASIMSPLFANALVSSTPTFTLQSNCEPTASIDAFRGKCENALDRSRRSISRKDLPTIGIAGDPMCARWTALVDITLNYFVNSFGKKNASTFGSWFDSYGFCICLRAHSMGINILEVEDFIILLGAKKDVWPKHKNLLDNLTTMIYESLNVSLEDDATAGLEVLKI